MKIAAAYIHTVPGDIRANLNETLALLRQLKKQSVNFVLFPELSLLGYSNSQRDITKALSQKEDLLNQLSEFSKESDISFAVGYPKLDRGHLFIAHHLFSRGRLTGSHTKSHLGPTEKEIFSQGNEISVFQTGPLKIGIQLCFETHFPEISYAQARQGANLLAMAFASPKETGAEKSERFKRFLCARAYDNACYVLACNLAGKTSKGAVLPGLAMIIDPKGRILAETSETGNNYCIATFSAKAIEHIHESRMAYFNHFKRNDLLKPFYE